MSKDLTQERFMGRLRHNVITCFVKVLFIAGDFIYECNVPDRIQCKRVKNDYCHILA